MAGQWIYLGSNAIHKGHNRIVLPKAVIDAVLPAHRDAYWGALTDGTGHILWNDRDNRWDKTGPEPETPEDDKKKVPDLLESYLKSELLSINIEVCTYDPVTKEEVSGNTWRMNIPKKLFQSGTDPVKKHMQMEYGEEKFFLTTPELREKEIVCVFSKEDVTRWITDPDDWLDEEDNKERLREDRTRLQDVILPTDIDPDSKPVVPSDTDFRQLFMYDPLRRAYSSREQLVPIVGPGVSTPLAGENWEDRISKVEADLGIDVDREKFFTQIISELKESSTVDQVQIEESLQHHFAVPPNRTTTDLQALVAATEPDEFYGIVVTTNLDTAVETAFAKAGKPLPSQNVAKGPTETAHTLEHFNSAPAHIAEDPIILKFRGSLEQPDTWSTEEKYEAAKASLRNLCDQETIPFFIGFGENKEWMFKLKREIWGLNSEAYALVELPTEIGAIKEHALKRAENLFYQYKIRYGITLMGYHPKTEKTGRDQGERHEYLDEIFECPPLRITKEITQDSESPILRIGGIKVSLSDEFIKDEHDTTSHEGSIFAEKIEEVNTRIEGAKIGPVGDILGNAIETRPPHPDEEINEDRERLYGFRKGRYVDEIDNQLQRNQLDSAQFELLVDGLKQYPDVLFERLVPWYLSKPDADFNAFLDDLSDEIDEVEEERIITLLRSHIKNDKLDYTIRQEIAEILRQKSSHPGLSFPPVSEVIDQNLEAAKYPLTRTQVGNMRQETLRDGLHPYTIESAKDIEDIMNELGGEWRLPTIDEWIQFADLEIEDGKIKRWPWGDEEPQLKKHAHLTFTESGGRVAEHPLPVGMFPAGKHDKHDLFDLIGNVFEVAEQFPKKLRLENKEDMSPHKRYVLIGGAYTTRFKPENEFSVILDWPTSEDMDLPIGIRPVRDVE